MSELFEIFQPGLKHWREQRDLEKVLVLRADQGARGPRPLDLESGAVEIEMPCAPLRDTHPPQDPATPRRGAHGGGG